jgi:hypothetical protein
MTQLTIVRGRLAGHGITRDSDFAELLVAEALRGERASAVNRGFDVFADQYGRVEVKCRRLPSGGRREERVELKDTKEDGFDYLAVVVFYPDYNIKGAVLLPYRAVWDIISARRYRRISYSEACCSRGAIDITDVVVKAAQA